MIEVYRMQDDDGRGPWRAGLSKYWRDDREGITETAMDLVGGINEMQSLPSGYVYGCACLSVEQLKQWFSEKERAILESIGYKIVKVKVSHIVACGKHQVLIASKKPFQECIVET